MREAIDDLKIDVALRSSLANGSAPEAKQIAKIAGVSDEKAREAVNDRSRMLSALSQVGITDDFLAQVAREGMEAKETRLVIHQGEVKDAIEIPDHFARHKFWRDTLMVRGDLGRENESSVAGGLIIVAPTAVQIQNGHEPNCNCADCVAAWERRAAELLSNRQHPLVLEEFRERRDDLDGAELLDPENFDAGAGEE